MRQLIGRVSERVGEWIFQQGYVSTAEEAKLFEQEIAAMALDQRMAFNSPVWFNVGVDRYGNKDSTKVQKESYIIEDGVAVLIPQGKEYEFPQTSACFIQSVEDTMEDILDLSKREGLLFKYGSGTGTDLSTLRSSHEKLSRGGKPSGPLAYLKFYDRIAEVVQSGGKTRRAAKMNSLRIDHPDIKEFIDAKRREQEKIGMLMEMGVDKDEAQATVAYQNANLSVRVTDEFMKAVEQGKMWKTKPVHNLEMADDMPEHDAKTLLRLMAEGTHSCGDPGIQYHTTINDWHTCPNSGEINASNPCSEYMFLDDSACNLASINLMKFRTPEGGFDITGFKDAVRKIIFSQDALIDRSSFPEQRIARHSHDFRPLGLGFANLGALIMSYGLAYDSEGGRALASSIMALETMTAYETSAELAEKLGPFKFFEENREPMLNVIGKHNEALRDIDESKIPKGLEEILHSAREVGKRVLERGQEVGFRNSQTTVLAPTGTIGFMMDCDTTGTEPDIALVKYKALSGGGNLKIVNKTVPLALDFLGYSTKDIEEITSYIDKNDTIEGAPNLKEEHLPVFDCALKPANGKRFINHMGHIKMMAGLQPFISGAISKTVNMPKEATVEDVEEVYMEGWKMGLKAVAIYRDGTKAGQPVSTSENLEKKVSPENAIYKNGRRRMPATRQSITHKATIGAGHELYLTLGHYDDGNLGELFIDMSKEGSALSGTLDTIGTLFSVALQHGVPLEALTSKMIGQRFEPSGFVIHPSERGRLGEEHDPIRSAKSIVDYIGRFIHERYNSNGEKPKEQEELQESDEEKPTKSIKPQMNRNDYELGGICPNCEDIMVKKGKCNELCLSCNHFEQAGCGE